VCYSAAGRFQQAAEALILESKFRLDVETSAVSRWVLDSLNGLHQRLESSEEVFWREARS
jgi:hypothetical protein